MPEWRYSARSREDIHTIHTQRQRHQDTMRITGGQKNNMEGGELIYLR
jgi:hypothetical protein